MITQASETNVQQAVPFFGVHDLARSLRFYVDGMGFTMTKKWVHDGALRWCWLELDGAALMLQEFWPADQREAYRPTRELGAGVTICFICRDALAIYRQALARGLAPRQPFVGNGMWVVSFTDPDGYRLDFESATDAPEESVYGGGATT
jgi:catechol 2,3-dioxygenase-like lactoylglutathione lyase family enzyme